MDELKKELKEEWFGQGINCVPIIFNFAALSAHKMHEGLGYSYIKWMCSYKDRYGDVHYWKKDLDRLSVIILDKLKSKGYMDHVLEIYRGHIASSKKFYSRFDKLDIKKLSKEESAKVAKEAGECIIDAIGVAHIIEPFSLMYDSKIKEMADKEIDDKKLVSEYFPLLISPSKKPFALEFDELLFKIKDENDEKKKALLVNKAIKDFFWVKNSYAGRKELKREDVLAEASSMKEYSKVDYSNIKEEKKKIMKKLGLSKELIFYLEITESFAELQDERKKNLLVAIDYFSRALDNLAEKYGLERDLMDYMLPHELDEKHLSDKNFKEELKKRKKGFVVVQLKDRVLFSTEINAVSDAHKHIAVISGIPTSQGTAIGRVKVCKNASQIGKVQEGDILVASMTRPEYVPAMRKAAAIITDEGGITCHAAVVARELGIPCIIGTKIATKVLKDNMLVEVKANHGIIEILEK